MHAKLNQENYEEGVKFRNAINNLGNLNINNQFENLWPILSAKLAKLGSNQSIHNYVKNDENVQITEAKLLCNFSRGKNSFSYHKNPNKFYFKKIYMDESIRNRLIQIDNECNEQIDRFLNLNARAGKQ